MAWWAALMWLVRGPEANSSGVASDRELDELDEEDEEDEDDEEAPEGM
jgi:hypothetical protein